MSDQLLHDLAALLEKHGAKVTWPSAAPAPRFVIHMIGFENLALSQKCIESVLANSTPGMYRLILTNNGSADGTREYFDQMAAQFSHITVIHEDENTGFQAPNENSFKLACEMQAEFHVSLNNDSTVPPGWLEKLAACFDADPKVAVAGPLGGCSHLNENFQGCDDLKFEYVEGSCMAVRVSIIQKWGRLFSPDLSFIYHDDSELCLRVQYAGYKIARAAFRLAHVGSQTAGAHPKAKAKCAEANARNEAVMKRKYAHWNRVRRFDHPILVRRKFASGDVLLTTPIVKGLAQKYALCPIYVETDRPEIFEGNPYVRKAALTIDLTQPDMRDVMVCDLDNSYERTPWRHVLECYAEVAGLREDEYERRLEYHGCEWGRNYRSIKPFVDRWVAIHIGPTTWPGKNWTMDRWNSLVQEIRARGYKVMIFGDGPKDASILCDQDLRGQYGLKELATLLARCSLFIGLCSFPAHLAAALEIPSVVLYGITDPKCFAVATAPYRAVCSDPAHPDTGRRNKEANVTFIQTDDSVMRTIQVADVIRAVDEVIK